MFCAVTRIIRHSLMYRVASKTIANKMTMMVLYRLPECLAEKVDNPMFHLVIPGVDPVLTPGASNEQTW